MSETRYNVVLTGHVQSYQDATAAAAKLATLMKLAPEQAEALLQGNASKVKTNVDAATAQRYMAALQKTGAEVRMDAITPEPVAAEVIAKPEPVAAEPEPVAAPTALALEEQAPPQQAPSYQPAAAPAETPYAAPTDNHLHPDEIRYCSHCGGEAHRTDATCPHCRRKLPTLGRSREVAAILALLPTGAWGIHRFYLGQWWGVFYLLFSWTMIPSVVSLVEFIVFLCTNREKWDEKHGHKNAVSAWIWALPAVFILITILGIVAAVALPAYQDYTTRTKVIETLMEVKPLEQDIEEFIGRTNFVPNSGLDMGKPDVGELSYATWTISENAVITLTFGEKTAGIQGESLTLIPYLEDDSFIWDCTGGTLDSKYRPHQCRAD